MNNLEITHKSELLQLWLPPPLTNDWCDDLWRSTFQTHCLMWLGRGVGGCGILVPEASVMNSDIQTES